LSNIFSVPIGDLILWFVVFLFSLSFHEAAHAWTSERFGDYTGRYQGRITLNPVAHIDPIGTILFPLMGFISGGIAMFGWAKPVETNPLLWRDKTKANIWVSAAGPISNFILATISFIAIKTLLETSVVYPPGHPLAQGGGGPFSFVVPAATQPEFMLPLVTLLCIFLILNLTLGVFNLIPIPPLDGSHVLESLLPYEMGQAYSQIRPWGFILLIALMMLGVFRMIIVPVLVFVLGLL
jgi:Zn-dependent protease